MPILATLLAVSLIVHQSSGQLKKCCPINEIVQIKSFFDNDLSSHPIYSCAKYSQHKNTTSAINNRIIQDEEAPMESKINGYPQSHEFIAYNILTDNHSHFPSCGDDGVLSRSKLNEPTKASIGSSCVDLLDGSYHVFSCMGSSNEHKDRTDIYKIKKCCPAGMSYDMFAHMCIKNNETNANENFRDMFNEKSVLFEYDKIKCDSEDVLVEYHSNVHDLKMFEGSLVISNYEGYGPEVFNRNYYCIESTIESAAVKPDGMSDEHFQKKSSSKWIANVCRNKAICSGIPCIRKCCPFGERLVHLNFSSGCEPHHQDISLMFYTFSNHDEQMVMDRMEPRGKFWC